MSSTTTPVASPIHADPALRILNCLLRSFRGSMALRLWNGITHHIGRASPAFTLVVRDSAVLRALVLDRSPILLADAYFRNRIDFEGDLYAVLRLKEHFQTLALSLRERCALWIDAMRLPRKHVSALSPAHNTALKADESFSHSHSKKSDRAAISFHYDLSNSFYKLWLDEQMVYSCAYFETPDDTLDQAQRNKLDHICRKLRLVSGERFLDIGCGWGALVCWAARNYGVRAHGITLSQEQFEYAQQRIATEGLGDLVSVELRDYRDMEGEAVFDKVASIGMFEHVGLANLPVYNASVYKVLRPGGLFLNHGITHDEEGWQPTVDTEFINRYVFPDGELDTVSNIQRGMENAGFEIHDVEGLRPHYALTLRHWVQRLETSHDQALQYVSETAYRVWRLYMAACALEFEAGGTGIYQILASKSGATTRPLPLTRRDLYQ
ncbi:cyclopropane-fatty-acyl-phospholipid synthase [Rugosibacter aromaticivorans]|uniref:Cyclopropane-fatty-acyl-phospholipid synthase n=1 Tax=Rugosibacter aromaticivorans TaxID=1565605 RepID=A0A0C5J8M9_9PROT|nr:class I SAM-dependent methyltransferase [Rugosibacter aromaticivorans]AJP48320.1 cyclopropane-fatty-acyl-phospholipid synthase [Rugosibacter aromaticivorans]TBR15164.1 MAG: methyltransferase domain-containing protein [Rugosibacter sp.]